MTADTASALVVPIVVAVIAAVPATLAAVAAARKVRAENTADHGRVRARLEELTATVASAEASNMAAHERLAEAVETVTTAAGAVASRLDVHAAEEDALHARLRAWLEAHES